MIKNQKFSKKADVTERGKDKILLLKKKNKKKGRIIGESVLKNWPNFSYLPP